MNKKQAKQLARKVQGRYTALLVEVKPTTEGTYVVVLSYSDSGREVRDFVCAVFVSDQDFEAMTAYAFYGASSVPFQAHHNEEDIRDFRRLIFYQIGDYARAREKVQD